MIEKRFNPHFLGQTETIFALGNGFLGMRGCSEEGGPADQEGTFVNGFYDSWPIVYGEEAYGFARKGQTMVNATDTKIIKLYVDDEPFWLPNANLLNYDRRLNMKAGMLEREVLWETPSGKQVLIKSKRLVSLRHRHLSAISYEVTVQNAEAPIVLSSEMTVGAPDSYLEGARRLGVEPQRTVVVEDAISGVQAGRNGKFGAQHP